MRKSDYAMTYFHIDDLEYNPMKMDSKEFYESYFHQTGTFKNRFVRMVKRSLGTKRAFDKMCSLVKALDYVNLEEADKLYDWGKAEIVTL